MHAAHSGRVSGEDLQTVSGLGVPHTERAVGGAADHQVTNHLRGPDAARVPNQRPQALKRKKTV